MGAVGKIETAKGPKGLYMELHQPQLDDRENPTSLARLYNVIKKFNRNTTWVATGLLGPVIFAALMVALQDGQVSSGHPTNEGGESTGNLSSIANAAGIINFPNPNEKHTSETVSEAPVSLDREPTPAVNGADVKPVPSVSGKDSAPAINEKIRRVRPRSSVRSRYISVKARLIALWHQSLRLQKSRSWTVSPNSNKWPNKNISYTDATNH
jgi:hypothetical protein